MAVFLIPLKHIIIDPANPINLATLPEQEAIRIIRHSYVFLASSLEVSIKDGFAIIEIKDDIPGKANKSKKTYERGVKEAQLGDYRKAITSFSKVLEKMPGNVDARRNLAMAYLELNDVTKAKELLEECLKLDPSNAWSFVLLGNIYAKNERNRTVAEFYYEAGLAASPEDNILLNNYATLQMENGNIAKAKELFEKALFANPAYPNTYIGLAYLHQMNHEPIKALFQLDRLFQQPKSSDIRTEQVYKNARSLYLEISEELARNESNKLIDLIETKKADFEKSTGIGISIEEDNSLEYISAKAQMAWKHGREKHRILYRMKSEAVTPHLIAHELEHIILEQEARERNKNLFFATTAETRELAIRSTANHIQKLQQHGYTEQSISKVILDLTSGLCGQIFNCPIDMIVEKNLYSKYPEMRHSQYISLYQMYLEALNPYNSAEVKKVTPPFIFRTSNTLNCANALFLDHLQEGRSDYASAYRSSDIFAAGKKLFSIWKNRMESFQPGDEYTLVDEFAHELKIRSWYTWKEDVTQSLIAAKESSANTPPLTTDKPDACTYCLDALQRFKGKNRDEIFSVVSEIGIVGMTGIDHTATDKKYALKTYHGEFFSGLHLLCLMYVGFKIYDPNVDCGIDFSGPYKIAKQLLEAQIH